MTELLTAAQMKAIETAAISAGSVTGLELMERAGRGVVEAVFEEWPDLAKTSHRAVVLCGPGNNGGDGFVVARLLKEWGWEVAVFLYGDADKLPPDAKVNYKRWKGMGEVNPLYPDGQSMSKAHETPITLIIDALFGTGLSRPFTNMRDKISTLQMAGNLASPSYANPKMVCIDLPSGICSDSGKTIGKEVPFGSSIVGHLTVTFHRLKQGHVLSRCAEACGNVVVKAIGLEKFRRTAFKISGTVVCRLNGGSVFGLSKSNYDNHKYSHGHALILSGGAGHTGAARLAARGALRIGAGVVTLGVPPTAQMEVAGHITAVMLTRVSDGAALAEILQDKRINALCLGPGMGLERARELMPVIFKTGGGLKARPTVLDADALSAYADAPQVLFDMLHENCILTPHGGEFARLFPDLSERLCEEPLKGPAYSKVDATRDAAKRAGCVVLFKGPDTVIAAPDGRCSINSAHYERSAPWLATAGSGDVLAGFITGLMARRFDPMQAAETAAWLHVECARSFGPGLIAEDLAEELPKVFTALML